MTLESNRRRRAENMAFLDDVKRETPCADCDGTFAPECMDFDHVDGPKGMEVSTLATRGASIDRLIDEIALCELVCANCHRVRTRSRQTARG